MFICGIDIGLTGAIGLLNEEGKFVRVWDMPVKKRENSTKRNEVHGRGLATIFDEIITLSKSDFPLFINCFAVIEMGGCRPENGVIQAYSSGDSSGVVRGVLSGMDIPHSLVTPKLWKGDMGLSKDKSVSLDLARRLFPSAHEFLKRKKDHGRAEALLLAWYGFERFNQQQKEEK